MARHNNYMNNAITLGSSVDKGIAKTPDERVCHNYSPYVCLVPRPIFGGPGNEVCVCVCVCVSVCV